MFHNFHFGLYCIPSSQRG